MKDSNHKYSNNLIHETSPYLLQHAHNPVDWSAWNPETLEKAKKENKLMIISIGYSSCHWCHVMEHESFEDTIVADLMNKHFIPIKVDREERPDVDDVYMTACNLINGSGGWPLNAIALPDGRPVWAGTYFPKDQWMNVLNQFIKLQNEDYGKLVQAAENLVTGLQGVDQIIEVKESSEFQEEALVSIGNKFLDNIDFTNGGKKGTQKFPLPNHYDFLLKYAYAYPSSDALKSVDLTLSRMASGGIYDQIEGGFSRYTVDKIWKVPHFEKMLYDNGQLVSLYSNAYRLTKNERYRDVVFETLDFIKTNWQDESGGYYSSYDADSEGEEGKFYIWTKEELAAIIPPSEFEEFVSYFNVTANGNWEDHNILYTDPDRALEGENFREKKEQWKKLILKVRKKRIYPGLDDKVLCSWNALLLNGYIDAYKAFGAESYRKDAIQIWEFIENKLLKDDLRLDRNYKNGKSTINAFLDDYALTIKGLIHLYEITFDESYLNKAEQMTGYVLDHFKSEKATMFNYTSDLDSPLIVQKIELMDGVIPSSNSIMARNLYALGSFLYKNEYLDISKQMLRNMQATIESSGQPNFYSNWCNLYFDMIYEPYEVAILGPDNEKIRAEMLAEYHPNALYLGGSDEGTLQLLESKLQEGENFVYVCVNKACKLPVQDAQSALKLLD